MRQWLRNPGRSRTRASPLLVGLVLLCCLAPESSGAQQDIPGQFQDLFREGVAAEKAGRLDEAEKAFLRVLREGGRSAYVYNNLGIVYQERGDHTRAIAQFRLAIRLQPDYVAPRILL